MFESLRCRLSPWLWRKTCATITAYRYRNHVGGKNSLQPKLVHKSYIYLVLLKTNRPPLKNGVLRLIDVLVQTPCFQRLCYVLGRVCGMFWSYQSRCISKILPTESPFDTNIIDHCHSVKALSDHEDASKKSWCPTASVPKDHPNDSCKNHNNCAMI